MLTMEKIENSTIRENTYGEMAFIARNKNIFECDEVELLEIMLDLLSDKILSLIKEQEAAIDHLEDLASDAHYYHYIFDELINKRLLKIDVLKEIRNMINEL